MKPADAGKAIAAGMSAKLLADKRKMLSAAHLGTEILASVAPVDVGTLKSSMHVEGGIMEPRIVIDAPHAATVELGSRPHVPPLQPLVDWVNRHRASFGLGRKPRSKKGAAQTDDPEVVRIARAIQAKIAREGTKPTYFVRNAIPKLVEALAQEMGS